MCIEVGLGMVTFSIEKSNVMLLENSLSCRLQCGLLDFSKSFGTVSIVEL